MGLNNTFLMGGWILIASKAHRRENLLCRFEDLLHQEFRIKRQTSYNYRNIYKLMSVALKLMNCRVNVTFFSKNHEIHFKYFYETETQTLWKHAFSCTNEPATV